MSFIISCNVDFPVFKEQRNNKTSKRRNKIKQATKQNQQQKEQSKIEHGKHKMKYTCYLLKTNGNQLLQIALSGKFITNVKLCIV